MVRLQQGGKGRLGIGRWIKRMAAVAFVAGAAFAVSVPAMSTAAKGKPAKEAKGDVRETCYQCHEEVKALKEGSKHARP
jgi:hypothetical protein